MAKTACEEAAEYVEAFSARGTLPKRLRAEGRELKRLRKLILAINATAYGQQPEWADIENESARIQKARKK